MHIFTFHMKKLSLALLLVVLSSFNNDVFADRWLFGVSPFGTQKINVSFTNFDDTYKLSFVPTMGFSVELRPQLTNGFIELSHIRGKLSEIEHLGESNLIAPTIGDNFSITSIISYVGRTFNDGERLQVPARIGLGFCYDSGAVLKKKLNLELGAKIGAIYYITDNLGVFCNACAKYGFGRKRISLDDGYARAKWKRNNTYIELGVALDLY